MYGAFKYYINKVIYKSWRMFLLCTPLFICIAFSSFGAARFAVASGNWNGSIWASTALGIPGTAATPTALDAVTINNGVSVSINSNVSASSVTVGVSGAGSATLHFNTAGNVSLSVANNVSVNDGVFTVNNVSGSRSHSLVVGGNLFVAAGCTFDMISSDGSDVCDVTFSKNGNASISGTGSVDFNKINLIMGFSTNNILDVTSVITMTNGGLGLLSGTFKLSSASTIVPFTTSANIPLTARLWNNGGIMNSTTSIDWSLAGILQVSAGTINHGNSSDDRIAPSALGTGVVNISGGNLNCSGRISNGTNAWTYIMTGGTLTVGIVGNTNAGYDPFNMDNANSCSFSMSGGTIVISKPGGSAGQNLGYHNTATLGTGFTGGTLQIGDAGTPAASTISIDTSIPIYNLDIASSNVTARLTTYNTTVSNNVSILSGIFSLNSKNLNLGNNWINDATFSATTATVIFNGKTSQSIGGSHATTFYNLRINNLTTALNSSTVVLYNDVNVTGLFTLTRGFMITSTNDILSLTSTASTTGSSIISFVNGPMRKTGTTAFIFPVGYGNGDKWARIGIGAPSTNTTFTAQYFALPFFNTTSMSVWTVPILNNVSTKEFWQLDRTAGTGTATVSLFWEDAAWSGINECTTADLRVARWAGASWENDNDGVLTSGTCAGATAGSVTTVLSMNYYGTLSFGSLTNVVNPLPVELIYFNAKSINEEVNVYWTTASEINNDYFEVQRSRDGKQFEKISDIKGAGNSNAPLNYTYTDHHPFDGTSYYRLRQVDFDGKNSMSKIVAVKRNIGNNLINNIYPNPARDIIHVNLYDNNIQDIKIEITDATGRKILEQSYSGTNQPQSFLLVTSHIESGIYSLRIIDVNAGLIMQEKRIVLKN